MRARLLPAPLTCVLHCFVVSQESPAATDITRLLQKYTLFLYYSTSCNCWRPLDHFARRRMQRERVCSGHSLRTGRDVARGRPASGITDQWQSVFIMSTLAFSSALMVLIQSKLIGGRDGILPRHTRAKPRKPGVLHFFCAAGRFVFIISSPSIHLHKLLWSTLRPCMLTHMRGVRC